MLRILCSSSLFQPSIYNPLITGSNGPLVAVLTEALARDNYKKSKDDKKVLEARRQVREFIQIIHRYRYNMLAKIKNPVENGIVGTDPNKAVHFEHTGCGEVEQVAILDYACVLWDADVRRENGTWSFHRFNGKNKCNPENNAENLKYMLNAYRVILTRARQGIVICIHKGNKRLTTEGFPEDPTRLPEVYDGTYECLKSIGLEEL